MEERAYRDDVRGQLARIRVVSELWRRPTHRALDVEMEARYGDTSDWSEDERDEVRRELLAEATARGVSGVERSASTGARRGVSTRAVDVWRRRR